MDFIPPALYSTTERVEIRAGGSKSGPREARRMGLVLCLSPRPPHVERALNRKDLRGGKLELLDGALKQPASGARPPGANRIDHFALAADRLREQRRHASYRTCGMRIAPSHDGQAQKPGDLEREKILLFRAGAVERLDRVDHAKNLEPGGAIGMRRIDRLVVRVHE